MRFHRVALLLGAALFQACQPQQPRADLVFINGAEPETLDPALITGQPEGRIAGALFEGLTVYDRTAHVKPGVAERWELSADGLTYTFHLRGDARWSNGEPVTARDFLRSWQRTLAPETASEYAYQLYYVKNGRAFNEGKLADFSQVGLRAPDERTLVVTLENPTPFFPDLCAFTTLQPVHLPTVEKFGDAWIKPGNIVGNGSYILETWRLNDRVRLRKNPFYWDRAHVAMETVDVLPSARPTTAFNYYATGQADLMMDKGLAPTALLDELRKRPDFHAAPFLGTYFMRFNVTKKPFGDARVRQAFALVVDRDLLVKKITRAGEQPALSFVPPGAAGYEPPQTTLVRDCDKARRLLADAGFPGGRGFPRVSYLYKGDSDLDRDIAVELQGLFERELGVRIELLGQEWKVYLRSLSALDFDICRSTWVGDYNDPNTFLDMFVTGGGNNRTGWGSVEYDHLIAKAARTLGRQARFDIFRRAEHLLVSEAAPVVPLYFYVGIQFYDGTRLGGIEANLLDEHPIREMFWKK
jgi:oligopeptide transport system substrate-binding protein